jgi:hypothetical protein
MPKRLLAAVAVLAVLTAACNSGHKAAVKAVEVQRTTTTEAPTTSTTLSPEQAVLAGYRAFWDDFIAVGMTSDGADPRLPMHSTGTELAQLRQAFSNARGQGLVQRGNVDIIPRVASITGTTALVADCILSHLQDVDAKTSQVRSSDPQIRVLNEYAMQLEAGVWKVSFVTKKGTGCTSA